MREPSGTTQGAVSLPGGGGGISSIGDRFQPDLVRGTGNYSVPLNLPKGANELQPSLKLTYSTGQGNGPFGYGWQLNISRIERRTDRGVPEFTDDDTFVLGGEILVPVGDSNGGRRYRPKTDTQFWLIERSREEEGDWHVRTGDGRMLLFGQTDASREFSDTNSNTIFAWYLEEEQDPAGNKVHYSYRRDGNQLYLEEMRYSIFRVRIKYEARPDILRNGRSGYERITALRASRIELHCDKLGPMTTLMRTWALHYTQAANGASFLTRLELFASESDDDGNDGGSGADGTKTARFPDLVFSYSDINFQNWRVHEMQAMVPPPRLGSAGTQLVDMTGNGLPDVLFSENGRTWLWKNRGDGWFYGPEALSGVPAMMSLNRSNVAFAYLDGNVRVELWAADQPLRIAFEADGKGGFRAEPIVFHDGPSLKLSSDDTRLMDGDGDGVIDLLSTGRNNILLFRHEPYEGWQEPQAVQRIHDLEKFPDVVFGERGVRLADMTGDGFQDLVVVRGQYVCYWPYYGNGRWGQRVEMDNPPLLPTGYRDERIFTVDIDGDGCSDIVYLDDDRTLIWLNQSGGGFAQLIEVPVSPALVARPFVADLLGDGRPGFAWDGMATSTESAGYRFMRFDEGHAPYLMTTVDNGLGGKFNIEYSTTTIERLNDQLLGREWPGELPFVVRVVHAIYEDETITGRRTSLVIHYSDGVYDGPEHQLRGFSHVSVEMSGDESVPASMQEVTIFQGDPEHPDLMERARQRALSGALLSTKTYERKSIDSDSNDPVDGADGDAGGSARWELRTESEQKWDLRLEYDEKDGDDVHFGGDGNMARLQRRHQRQIVYFPFVRQIETHELSVTADQPQRVERTIIKDFDVHGNPGRRIRESFIQGEPQSQWIRSEERFSYVNDETKWLVKLPVRSELRNGTTNLTHAVQVRYYDGPAFVGLNEGEATQGLVTRMQELRLLESRLPADYIGSRNLASLGYELAGSGDTRGWYANTMSVRRDGFGNIAEQRDPMAIPLLIEYDAEGVFPVRTTDSRGKQIEFTFSVRSGEPLETRFADGRVVRNEFDAIGRLVATFETNDDGNEQLVKCWLVDVVHLPASIISIAPSTAGHTRAEFTPATNFNTVTGASVSRIFFDGFGKQIMQVTTGPHGPGGARRFVESDRVLLNPKGLVKVKFLPRFVADLSYTPISSPVETDTGAQVRQWYDVQGSVVETAGPGPAHFRVVRNSFTITHYEGVGAGVPGSVSSALTQPARLEYFDARGRLVRIEESKGDGTTVIATSYTLTLDGRIESVHDNAGREQTQYSYAGPGEPIRISNRDAGVRTYYRDAGGKLVERIDADGTKLFHTYDVQGRLIKIESESDGVAGADRDDGLPRLTTIREIFYDIDPVQPSEDRFLEGRIALLREAGNEMRYCYDRAGKKVREEVKTAGVTLAVHRRYNLQGNLTSITYPDGRRVDYVLDQSGSVTEIPGIANHIQFGADGTLEAYTTANGIAVSLQRDPVSTRLMTIGAALGGKILRRIDYTYDSAGQITTMRDEIPENVEFHNFRYDGLYRLIGYETRINNSSGGLLTAGQYSYDPEGNLLRFEDIRNSSFGYGDALHPSRITTITNGGSAPQTISYNDRGHISSMAGSGLSAIKYDTMDHLSEATMADETLLRFWYDENSQRILKEVTKNNGTPTTTARVHYIAGLFEKHESYAIRHIYLGKHLMASERVSDPTSSVRPVYYLSDHHGTVLLATDGQGAVISNQRYTPFGHARNNTDSLDRYLGRERDRETGLLHLGARYYSPDLGRFISADWFVLENPTKPARMPQAYNVYSYALNNPLIFKDPSGMFIFIIAGVIVAIATIAAIATVAAFAVGFISGLIFGLANGQGWGSLLTALETALTTTVGMWLGGITGFIVGGPIGLVIGAVMGGMNGLISGMTGIYNWGSIDGWLAFLSDSTWGLLGTSLGNIVHVINLFWPNSNYRYDLSHRQNRHVYEGGFALKSDMAFTQGNVISNAGLGSGSVNTSFIANHEELHIWQSRIFGPLFQLTYVVWAVGGFIVASFYWFFNTDEDWGSLVETAAYYDNPFEYWAYNNDSNWPPSGANPSLRWG
jgi:RHS repeat-associated protein